jgi:hypothetical protein
VFNRISVWLDESAPDEGAFAHAIDWAARLHLPLHAVAAPVPSNAADPLSGRTLEACHAACVRKGVSQETEFLLPRVAEKGGFSRGGELCVFGANLPSAVRDRLVRESLANPTVSVMVCSPVCRQASRSLILHNNRGHGVEFLTRLVPLCRALATRPVVLTVARTERCAVERQESARGVFYSNGLDADFDLIAGCEVRTAVAWAAQARGCSRVIMERENTAPWWRWLRGDSAWRLIGLAGKLTLIMLPTSDAATVPPDSGCQQN